MMDTLFDPISLDVMTHHLRSPWVWMSAVIYFFLYRETRFRYLWVWVGLTFVNQFLWHYILGPHTGTSYSLLIEARGMAALFQVGVIFLVVKGWQSYDRTNYPELYRDVS